MNYFNFTSKRSSYEQLENDDSDDSSSASSSASSSHSNHEKQQFQHHQQGYNMSKSNNQNNTSSNSVLSMSEFTTATATALRATTAAASPTTSPCSHRTRRRRHNHDAGDSSNEGGTGGMLQLVYEYWKQQELPFSATPPFYYCKPRIRHRQPRRGNYYVRKLVCLLGSILVLMFLKTILVSRHSSSSSSSTTNPKPAEVVVPISHKERLPTFFSIHDGNDYLYALDNPLYIALETATFHNANNANSHDAAAADHPISITVTPSRIQSHDEPLRVTFSSTGAVSIHDSDVLIFVCGNHESELQSLSFSIRGGNPLPRGVQHYSDILEAATMTQVKSTHEFNIRQAQQFLGSTRSGGSPAAATAGAAANVAAAKNVSSWKDQNEYEWFIPYLPMIRQPVCHFLLYRPQQQQQQQRYSNDEDSTPSSFTSNTDYTLMAASNLLYITSVMQPSMIHLSGTASPTEMVVSFTTGYGVSTGGSSTGTTGSPVSSNMMQQPQQQAPVLSAASTVTPVAVYSRLVGDYHDSAMSRAVVANDNDFVQSRQGARHPLLHDGDGSNDDDEHHRVTGITTTYTAQDLCSAPANITAPGKFMLPGLLHTVTMHNLIPNAMYEYRVGVVVQVDSSDSNNSVTYWSDYFVFQAAPPLPLLYNVNDDDDDDDFEPFAYLVYGDQGCPREGWVQGAAWTASMVSREVLNNNHDNDDDEKRLPVRAVHHYGDLSYAQGNAHQWDEWFQMLQPMAARVPLHVAVGNHEYDYREGGLGKDPSLVAYHRDNNDGTTIKSSSKYADGHGFHPDWGDYSNDSGGECGVPTAKRFTMPSSTMTRSNGVFWYSHIFASMHTIVLSAEHDLDYGSPQHSWLVKELSVAVNRTRTPWLVVEMHRPLYEGEAKWSENTVGLAHRQELEYLFFDYKVDVVFAGHYHAYHRACDGLYQSVCNQGGPLHLTLGTAGGLLDVEPSYENDWSVVLLEKEYGYGRVSVHNRTTMHIEFVRAGAPGDPRAGQVLDDVWVHRER